MIDFHPKKPISSLMEQSLTYIIMTFIVLLSALALYKVRQPRELGKSWHIPWNGVLFLNMLILLLLIRHLLTLSGIDLPSR